MNYCSPTGNTNGAGDLTGQATGRRFPVGLKIV